MTLQSSNLFSLSVPIGYTAGTYGGYFSGPDLITQYYYQKRRGIWI